MTPASFYASPAHADPLAAYRRLAARVIEMALRDLQIPSRPGGDRDSAIQFLVGAPMLYHWCDLAGIDVKRVIACGERARLQPPPAAKLPAVLSASH